MNHGVLRTKTISVDFICIHAIYLNFEALLSVSVCILALSLTFPVDKRYYAYTMLIEVRTLLWCRGGGCTFFLHKITEHNIASTAKLSRTIRTRST